MGTKQALKFCRTGSRAWRVATLLVLTSAFAFAQGAAPSSETRQEDTGVFAAVGRWFSQQSANVNATFKDARQKVEGFSQDEGADAKSTVDGAKDAAGAVARIPNVRTVSVHEKC